jgi:hypothetical protein
MDASRPVLPAFWVNLAAHCLRHGRRADRVSGTARPRDDDEPDAYVKEVVDSLPPLTDGQRDLLALIFRSNRGK